jgi:DnaJ homolog subfamily C member 9
VTAEVLETERKKYQGSDEEKTDVLAAYTQHKGSMDGIFESVMFSDVLVDDTRFRDIIKAAIAAGEVESYDKFTNETEATKKKRRKAATAEAAEAEELAKELGLDTKLYGKKEKGNGRKDKKKEGVDDLSGLAALISQRQKDRGFQSASFMDRLEEKYGPKSGSRTTKKGSKKRARDHQDEDLGDEEDTGHYDEPDEEAFQKAASKLKHREAESRDTAASEPRRNTKRGKK